MPLVPVLVRDEIEDTSSTVGIPRRFIEYTIPYIPTIDPTDVVYLGDNVRLENLIVYVDEDDVFNDNVTFAIYNTELTDLFAAFYIPENTSGAIPLQFPSFFVPVNGPTRLSFAVTNGNITTGILRVAVTVSYDPVPSVPVGNLIIPLPDPVEVGSITQFLLGTQENLPVIDPEQTLMRQLGRYFYNFNISLTRLQLEQLLNELKLEILGVTEENLPNLTYNNLFLIQEAIEQIGSGITILETNNFNSETDIFLNKLYLVLDDSTNNNNSSFYIVTNVTNRTFTRLVLGTDGSGSIDTSNFVLKTDLGIFQDFVTSFEKTEYAIVFRSVNSPSSTFNIPAIAESYPTALVEQNSSVVIPGYNNSTIVKFWYGKENNLLENNTTIDITFNGVKLNPEITDTTEISVVTLDGTIIATEQVQVNYISQDLNVAVSIIDNAGTVEATIAASPVF
jgi:hypothetical protein